MRPSATFLVSILGCSTPHYCLLYKQIRPVPEGLLGQVVPSRAGTNHPPLTVRKNIDSPFLTPVTRNFFSKSQTKSFHMLWYKLLLSLLMSGCHQPVTGISVPERQSFQMTPDSTGDLFIVVLK